MGLKMTQKILTVRVSVPIYSELCANAAEQGIPIAVHVRRLLEREHNVEHAHQLHRELLAKLDNLSVAPPTAPLQCSVMDEILLLCRATALHLNPQLVAQVRAKLAGQTQSELK